MATNSESDLQFIISCAQHFWPDMPITVNLLEFPTSEFVIEFYQRFRETMNDIYSRIVNNAADAPKVNDDSIFSILRFVNKYLRESLNNETDVECVSVTLTDMYEPTAKRTKVRFKLLLNFLLFCEDQIPIITDVVTKRLEKAQVYENKMAEKEALKENLAREAESLASLDDELNKLQKEEEKANLRYKTLQQQQSEKDVHHAKLQKELRELVNLYENKHTLLTNVKTNIERLNEQVVSEENYKTLVDLKKSLVKKSSELQTDIECLGETLGKRKPEVERFDDINKQLIILQGASEEVSLLQNSVSSASTSLQLSGENYERKSEELKASTENILQLRERTKAIQEALQSTTVNNKTLEMQMQQELEQLKSEFKEEQEFQNAVLLQKGTLQEKIEEAEKQVKEMELEIEKLNLSFADTYKNMLSMENASTSKIYGTLENIKEALLQDQEQKALVDEHMKRL